MDVNVLQKAKDDGYLLAVDPKDLPKETGWYFVDRKNNCFVPIDENAADKLIKDGCWNEVLYVNKSAIHAAEESHPVTLGVVYESREYLDVWPGNVALVVLSGEVSAPQAQANEIPSGISKREDAK